MSTDFLLIEAADVEPPEWNPDEPEDILIEVIIGEGELLFETIQVISATNGFASYEKSEGCLDYMIQSRLGPEDFPNGGGWYVIEGCTGRWIRGDGWMTDDDAEFYPGAIRPATIEEIAQA